MLQKKDGQPDRGMARSLEEPFAQGIDATAGEGGDVERAENPLRDLKAEVLSIDWEITDKVMSRFIGEVERLRHTYKDDKVLLVFLTLLHSIGKYVKFNKGKSHPDAIKLLNSVYKSLEKVLQLKGSTEEEREKILSVEVERFKKLKAQIAQKKFLASTGELRITRRQEKAEKERKGPAPGGQTRPDASPKLEAPPTESIPPALHAALEEIKALMRSEFRALRAELKMHLERVVRPAE